MGDAKKMAADKWRSSGLSDEVAKKLKLKPLSAQEVTKLSPSFRAAASLHIPYPTLEGKVTEKSFYRIRYLEEPPGFQFAKPMRYVQPPNTTSEVYFPPLIDWKAVAGDQTRPVLITEGELKAACVTANGLPCIGLGGVQSWKSSKRGVSLLSGLEKFTWSGREVVIVFDSDINTNPDVLRAALQLAARLTDEGASVRIAEIPAVEGKKFGADDYIVEFGAKQFIDSVIAGARAHEEGMALWKMNEEVCFIEDGFVLRKSNNSKINPALFKTATHVDRRHYEQQMDKEGNPKMVERCTAVEWMKWPQRDKYDSLVFEPGLPKVVNGKFRKFNLWNGWEITPKKGDIGPWKTMLDYMFQGDAAARKWFEQWCAYPFQNPGVKMFASVLVWGARHGTGKSLVGYTLGDLYGEYFSKITNRDLAEQRNAWAEGKLFVLGDEVTGNDKRGHADYLKDITTQETINIDQKYIPPYSLPNRFNLYFTSNHPDAFFLEDDDRRNFIWEMPDEPLPEEFYLKTYDSWRRSDEGRAALFYHLLHISTEGFHPKARAPDTQAKRDMIIDSKSDIGAWVAAVKEDPERMLMALGAKRSAECDLFTNQELLRCYDPEGVKKVTANGLGREMKRARIKSFPPVWTAFGTQRLYAVRNADKWARVHFKVRADHWESSLGKASGKLKGKKDV